MAEEEKAKKVSGAEEYVSAEVALAEPLDPEQEKALRDALENLDERAFGSFDIGAKRLSFSYDPTRTSKKQLLDFIRQAGGKPGQVESGGSPLLQEAEDRPLGGATLTQAEIGAAGAGEAEAA